MKTTKPLKLIKILRCENFIVVDQLLTQKIISKELVNTCEQMISEIMAFSLYWLKKLPGYFLQARDFMDTKGRIDKSVEYEKMLTSREIVMYEFGYELVHCWEVLFKNEEENESPARRRKTDSTIPKTKTTVRMAEIKPKFIIRA